MGFAKRVAGLALATALALFSSTSDARSVDLRHLRVTDSAIFAPIGPGGADARLTLDPPLQRACERILTNSAAHEGAIVVSDVRTGRILAWAARGDRDYVSDAFAPSASLFKVVTASALLEGGKVSPMTRECFEGGEHALHPADLERRGSFCSTVGEALGHSYNIVFARLSKRFLTPSDLRHYAAELGFSGEVPIDVPVDGSDVRIPDDAFGMARASAGFWNGRLVPLGALFAMQTIANDGERIRLSLLDPGGAPPRVSLGRAIGVGTARTLTRMLEVTTRRGTAAKAFHRADGSPYLAQIAVAAKTGTLIGGSPSRMYSWFAAFAPSTKPEIAVSVMLGNDLRWRTKANIVGREVLGAYFSVAAAPSARIASRRGSNRRRR